MSHSASPSPSGPLVVSRLSAGYGPSAVFRDVSFSVRPGQTVAVVGPSGCGKTTLLRAVAGLMESMEGTVTLDGASVAAGDRRVSLVLQHYGLFPWFSVHENVALGLKLQGVNRRERALRVAAELERIGLRGYEERLPSELSSGQQQRVAIARSLALQPELLLMDEPFSALDALARESLQDLVVELLAEQMLRTVVVTHSIQEAVFLASKVYVMGGAPVSRLLAEVDAPSAAMPELRREPRFFDACSQVRRSLEAILGR